MIIRFLGLIFSIVLLIVSIFQKRFKKWKKAGLVFISLLFLFFMTVEYLFPLLPAPKPSGDMNVLVDTVFYSYETDNLEMLTNDNEREIPVMVWYPENLENKKHSLFLFSCGSFGIAQSNETLFLELASRGYIVMSLNHPYHSFESKMSDGSTISIDYNFLKNVISIQGSEDLEGTFKTLNELTDIRIDDINCVLNKILDPYKDNEYEEYIDKNHIILSGHSLGGSAMLAIGRDRSNEVKALIILESPFVKDIIGIDNDKYIFIDGEYPLPILHIYSDHIYFKLDEITTYEMNARLLNSNNPMFVNKHIKGVGHLGLTDMSLATPVITNLIDLGHNKRKAPETLLEINEYVLDFLEEYNK